MDREKKPSTGARIWLRRSLAGAVLLVATVGVLVWLGLRSATGKECPSISVEVDNAGQAPLSLVKVCLGDHCATRNTLAPGDTWTAEVVPASESSVVITYHGEKDQRADLDLYVEPGWSGRVTVSLSNGTASVGRNDLQHARGWTNSMCAVPDEPG